MFNYCSSTSFISFFDFLLISSQNLFYFIYFFAILYLDLLLLDFICFKVGSYVYVNSKHLVTCKWCLKFLMKFFYWLSILLDFEGRNWGGNFDKIERWQFSSLRTGRRSWRAETDRNRQFGRPTIDRFQWHSKAIRNIPIWGLYPN